MLINHVRSRLSSAPSAHRRTFLWSPSHFARPSHLIHQTSIFNYTPYINKKKKLIIILNNNLFFRRFKIIYIISFITEAGFNVQYPFSYCVVFNLYWRLLVCSFLFFYFYSLYLTLFLFNCWAVYKHVARKCPLWRPTVSSLWIVFRNFFPMLSLWGVSSMYSLIGDIFGLRFNV